MENFTHGCHIISIFRLPDPHNASYINLSQASHKASHIFSENKVTQCQWMIGICEEKVVLV